MANFVQTGKKTVSLMFMRGGKIEGDFPHTRASAGPFGSCASPMLRRSTPLPLS